MEDLGNLKWQELLAQFKGAIHNSPPPADVIDCFRDIKKEAVNSGLLTARQIEGIVARCDNYLNGEYGNSKQNFEIGEKPQKK
jgi:hypothetical protein